MLWVSAVAFGVAWWLGLYLMARDSRKPVLRRAGIGLLAYAAAVVGDAVAVNGTWFDGIRLVLVCLPALAWTGVFIRLLPDRFVERADRLWRLALVPACALLAMPAAAGFLPAGYFLGALAVAALLVTMLAVMLRYDFAVGPHRSVAGLLTVGALMFGLSASLILVGFHALPRTAMLSAVAVDLVLLGIGIAVLDAFDEGEALRADMVRSLLVSALTAAVFGGQAAVAIVLAGERTPLLALLFGAVAAAIAMQVLNAPLQASVDRLAFTSPQLRQERSELRTAAEALPRKEAETGLAALGEDEFARLTRRALSHYADLGKLVSSPLIDLPAIDARLAGRDATGPLDRAAELKALLSESITHLKPRTGEDFGTSEEWRHYNSVYFYYVAGIRPYSVRTKRTDLDPVSRRALAWFVDQVPERTLHNWQNAAARMIAAQLRSGIDSLPS
ncbi:hypothetical protein [Nocardia huaxiensis]|uniref:Uncharacterized protein n=1 Tax=Nocardia huaxiensis TaxID=2755382 RepID=A0A7D6ZFS5_9NOCA|nr:hypothetical protein [Nocardia huaxiensis]QLY29879.1 hypothetical protein H0264_32475 [Nocardia huaxiensis]UFS96533.1 hypothetical protein LPY97_00895 [Nocardia huaxiensis]